jgi:type IV secretion system protein TrbL
MTSPSLAAFGAVADGVINAGKSMAANAPLKDYGYQILAGLTTFQLVWNGLKALLQGDDVRKLLATVLTLLMMASITSAMIGGIGGGGTQDITAVIVETTDAFADKIAGTSGTSSTDQMLRPVYSSFKAAGQVWNLESPKGTDDDSEGLWTKIVKTVESFAVFIITFLPIFAMKIITMFVIVICGAILLAQFIISQTMVQIAIVLAPVFLPWFVWEPASFLFDSWLRFFLKACFAKVIGVLMMTLMESLITVSNDSITALTGTDLSVTGPFVLWIELIFLLVIALLQIAMFIQVNGIADQLLSGSARATATFKPVTAAAKNVASVIKMAKGGGGGGSKGGGGGGSGSAKGAH